MDKFKDLVDFLARQLSDAPDEVKVSEEVDNDGNHSITLKVHKNDLGKVIGKQGKMANAMRAVLKAGAGKFNKRCSLDILE